MVVMWSRWHWGTESAQSVGGDPAGQLKGDSRALLLHAGTRRAEEFRTGGEKAQPNILSSRSILFGFWWTQLSASMVLVLWEEDSHQSLKQN